jgi:hypothetical protein
LEQAILDKLKEQIEELKSKIPFLNKSAKNKNDEDESEESDEEESSEESDEEQEDQEDSDEPQSDLPPWKAKLLEQLPFLSKFLNPQGASSASSDDKTDPNIKIPSADDKKKKLIRFAIIGGIVLYFALEMISGDPAKEGDIAVEGEGVEVPKPKKKRDRKAEQPVAEGETPKVEEGAETPAPVIPDLVEGPAQDPVDTPGTEDPPVGDIVVDGMDSIDLPPVDEGSAPDVPDLSDDVDPDLQAQDNDDIFKLNPEGETSSGDQVSETPQGDQNDMTEQILLDLEKQVQSKQETIPGISNEYTSPPEYEYVGRGLVYNCKGKHWACIDAPSFKTCQQNFNALKSQSRSKECVPDSVYETDSACVWVQKKKITTNTKTDFCN